VVVSGGAGRPRETQTSKEATMAHVLVFMNLASDIMAISVAITSLMDTALRRRSDYDR
jgi:hypothetical protein